MAQTIERTLIHAKTIARHLNKSNPEYVALAVLLELGVPTRRDGFYQLLNAIVLFCKDPTRAFFKDIYPAVGKMCGADEDPDQVDQAIRQAISVAWKNRDEEVWAIYFPAGRKGAVQKPSNTEFISRIGWFIKLFQGCYREVDYAKE